MATRATDFASAVNVFIPDTNRIHDIINGDATTEVAVENGFIPSIRKVYSDSLYFLSTVLPWEAEQQAFDPRQLYNFNGLLYWAPTATASNPVSLGLTPVGNPTWHLAPIKWNYLQSVAISNNTTTDNVALLKTGIIDTEQGVNYFFEGNTGLVYEYKGEPLTGEITDITTVNPSSIKITVGGVEYKILSAEKINLLQSVAISNNTTVDNVDFLKTGQIETVGGINYLYNLENGLVYEHKGDPLTGDITEIITVTESYIELTLDSTTYRMYPPEKIGDLEAVAISNNTTTDNVAFLSIGETLSGQEYLRVKDEEKTYYAQGGVSGTVSFFDSSVVTTEVGDYPFRASKTGDAEAKSVDRPLIKTDSMKVMFDLTSSILTLNQDVVIKGVRLLSGTEVTLPTLTNASDYKILLLSDGSLSAQLYDTVSPAGSAMVGGFHVYHTTGGINPRSLWDENWRPSGKLPRACALSPDNRVWGDIYFMDEEYALYGYSRPDVIIADGDNPPKVPALYGGVGVGTYGSLSWFEAWDLAINAGKRLASWGEFSGLAYGVVERQSVGTDPVTTKYQAGHRSAIGLEQAAGVMWTWGADTQGSTGAAAAITDGRGSVFSNDPRAVLLGARWADIIDAGSRSAAWCDPSDSRNYISVRAVCDHLIK